LAEDVSGEKRDFIVKVGELLGQPLLEGVSLDNYELLVLRALKRIVADMALIKAKLGIS